MTGEETELFLQTLEQSSRAVGVPLTPEQREQCRLYTERLLAVNQHTNLTRITAPAEVAVKHFADSLTVLSAVPDLREGAMVADVGTGAGFPGLVLKLARPDLRLCLLDSLGKRLSFLEAVVAELGLSEVWTLHARGEEAGRTAAHRDRYDLVTARAVAALPTLLEWCVPLVRAEGRFVAMKAGNLEEELPASAHAAKALKTRLIEDLPLTLPSPEGEATAERRLLVYRKFAPTPARYPRPTAEIKAKPL